MSPQSNPGSTGNGKPPADVMAKLASNGFSLLPLGGGDDGKSPLLEFSQKPRIPLRQVLGPMFGCNSGCFGIRLEGLTVLDCDIDDLDTVKMLETRFGESACHVKTSRGRHLYYRGQLDVRPSLREEGLPVDVKSGVNSYVVGPGSLRPDGGRYTIVKGRLSLAELSSIRQVNPRTPAIRPIACGERHVRLTKEARAMVEFVDTAEELAANLLYIRDEQCEEPGTMTDAEVQKIAEWAWQKRLEGKLYSPQQNELRIRRQSLAVLRELPSFTDAISLYVTLLECHGHIPGKRFALNHQRMRVTRRTDLSRERFLSARRALQETGFLVVASKAVTGERATLYQLANPIASGLPSTILRHQFR